MKQIKALTIQEVLAKAKQYFEEKEKATEEKIVIVRVAADVIVPANGSHTERQ